MIVVLTQLFDVRVPRLPSTLPLDVVIPRAVWDGNQILAEQRTSGLDGITGGAPDYGTIRHIHVLGIDAPVAVVDNRFMGARVLHYNWRGLAEASSWSTGAPADNQLAGGSGEIAWPAGRLDGGHLLIVTYSTPCHFAIDSSSSET